MRNTEVSRLLEHYAYIRTYLNITCIPIHVDTYASRCSRLRYIMHVTSLPRSVGWLIRRGNVYRPEVGGEKFTGESQREIYKHSTRSIEHLENGHFVGFSFSFLVRKRDRHWTMLRWRNWIHYSETQKKHSTEEININKLQCRMKWLDHTFLSVFFFL